MRISPDIKAGKPGNKTTLGRKKQPGDKKRGPKPNWYKEKCEKLLRRGNLFNVLSDVATGKEIETHVTLSGKKVKVSASTRNRIAAITELRDTAFGKPASSLDVTTGGKPLPALPSLIEEARKRAGNRNY